jgi:signal transduction protein with GAF and PtsI domain
MENKNLYEEIKKRDKQIELLSKVSRTVVSGKYLDDILNMIANITAETMGLRICSIMLFDEKKQELAIKATQSLSKKYCNKPNLKIGQSISGKAVKSKKPFSVLDVTKEPDYMYPKIASEEGLCSMLAVPMIMNERVVGVINLYTSEEHVFSDEEIKILQSISDQAASVIENTKLMEEALKARESLKVRKLVEQAKGILMKEFRMDEEQAYRSIHQKSMNLRKSMKEVAEAIILALGKSSTDIDRK